MTTKVVKWGSNDGQITKSELSNGRRAKLLPSVAEFSYDWLQFEDYLGNVGLDIIRKFKIAAFGNDDLRRVRLQGTRHFLIVAIHTEKETPGTYFTWTTLRGRPTLPS